MQYAGRLRLTFGIAIVAAFALTGRKVSTQTDQPANDAPNPYRSVEG